MKNNQWYIDFFSLLSMSMLTLFIVVACSSKDYLESDDIVLEKKSIKTFIENSFKDNFIGTYIPNKTAILKLDDNVMDFNSGDFSVTLSTNIDNLLHLEIMFNDDTAISNINRIIFIENNIIDASAPIFYQQNNSEGLQKMTNIFYVQEIIPQTSTHIFLQNIVIYLNNKPFIYKDALELIINPDNGELFLDGVKIAKKSNI